MIRFVLLLSVLAVPWAVPVLAQTALDDRPGRWIEIPRTESAAVMEAPVSGPLITVAPSSGVMLNPVETDTAALITPLPEVPDTRPVPRPASSGLALAEAGSAVVAPAQRPRAAAVFEAVVEAMPDVAAFAPAPEPVPAPQPVPRSETAATVAMAEALGAELAARAREIMAASPRVLPRVEGIAPDEELEPEQLVATPEAASRTAGPLAIAAPVALPVAAVAPTRALTPPSVVPVLAASFTSGPQVALSAPAPAVLLPRASVLEALSARAFVQPAAFIIAPPDATPILPRQNPSGPGAMVRLVAPPAPAVISLSAVLVPSVASRPAPVPRLARAPVPDRGLFPLSALPPSALGQGPESLARVIQPSAHFAGANAAVLTGTPPMIPARLPAMAPSTAPAREMPFTDPEVEMVLPQPDAGALARMMDDAMICWRMADLSMEARWARLSVDVALDETNMPSAASIRLTGFAHVVSGAAEQAYRAAHGALTGCAEATENAPATASTTLVFDRSGVRLQ